jgi:hypothetical protein
MNNPKPRKVGAVRKEVTKTYKSEPVGPFFLALHDVRRDPLFQVRERLVPDNLRKLRSAYLSGKRITPILVAFVDGEELPFVIDGHHRYAVQEHIGVEVIEVLAMGSSKREARWAAARANLEHGQPLKTRELRPVFRAYISSRQHILRDGASQSYAEIGEAIGVRKNTIWHWMKRDFPAIFQKMSRDDMPSGEREKPTHVPPVVDRMATFNDHLRAIRDEFEATSAEDQHEVLRMIDAAVRNLREVHEATTPSENPFANPQ